MKKGRCSANKENLNTFASKEDRSSHKQMHSLVDDLGRAEALLQGLLGMPKSNSELVLKIKTLERKFTTLVNQLLQENKSFRKRLSKYESVDAPIRKLTEIRADSSSSRSADESVLSHESQSLYTESARRFLTNIYECPTDLLKHFKGGPGPQCRLIPQGHDQALKGVSLALFKFIAVGQDERDHETVRSLLELSHLRFDQYQDSTIPERYHYLYNNQILKSAILSMLRALSEIKNDSAFFEIVQEYPVYEFLSMIFLRTVCVEAESLTGAPAVSFFEPLSFEVLVNTIGSLFELTPYTDTGKGFCIFQRGQVSFAVLLSEEQVLVFDVEQNAMNMISEESEQSFE